MVFHPGRTAIVGATGPTGFHLARELVNRGRAVRVVSRRRDHLEQVFDDLPVEIATADALDPDSLARAVEGCDLVVDAIGLPPERMADHPATARNVASAAGAAGARCLLVSSYWSFLPHRGEVVSESHPREGGHEWFRLRREAEDVLLAAGAAVIHLPDFFGPHVHTGSVQLALEDALAGRPISALGGAGVEREAASVPDAMRTVADLAEREDAYGTDWAIPGNATPSPRDLARIAGEHLRREVKVRAVPPWVVRLLALVSPKLRPPRRWPRPSIGWLSGTAPDVAAVTASARSGRRSDRRDRTSTPAAGRPAAGAGLSGCGSWPSPASSRRLCAEAASDRGALSRRRPPRRSPGRRRGRPGAPRPGARPHGSLRRRAPGRPAGGGRVVAVRSDHRGPGAHGDRHHTARPLPALRRAPGGRRALPPNLLAARRLVESIRASGSRKILVGGRAFSSVRSVWREIGAEGLAEAVEAARRLGPGIETSEPGT